MSPIQLIPNFIPVIGFLDDFVVLFLGIRLLQKLTPPELFRECCDLADAAEVRRNQEPKWAGAVVVPVIIVTVWILVAISASTLLAAYIYH